LCKAGSVTHRSCGAFFVNSKVCDRSALEGWIAPSRTTPGRQRKFSNLAIEATLVVGTVFKLPLRQTEGFVRSLMALLKRDLPVPDHTTLARRRSTW
ncbi:MAG: transposase, partial [Pseudomonadota bacterium]